MFGRPVVASSIAALKERITDGVNGFTFPARDSRALAALMTSLAGNETRWKAVNKTIEQPWTDVDMLEAHLSVWREFKDRRRAVGKSLVVHKPKVRGDEDVVLASERPGENAALPLVARKRAGKGGPSKGKGRGGIRTEEAIPVPAAIGSGAIAPSLS